MLARNAVDRLAVGKCLSHQGSLLVLAPAPSRLTQNNLHMASARDQSKRPVDRLGAAKILTYKSHHARRPSAQGYNSLVQYAVQDDRTFSSLISKIVGDWLRKQNKQDS
jgi:hypothetical protein